MINYKRRVKNTSRRLKRSKTVFNVLLFLCIILIDNWGDYCLMKKTKKEKKRLFVISTMIVFLLVVLVKSVANDWTEIMDNSHKIKQLNEEYNNLMAEEEKLESDVTKLQDSDYIARYAKEKYLYSEEGDTIIRMDGD